MAKLWEGRSSAATDKAADDFNSSIRFDSRMYREDICGSVAHAAMLARSGIISEGDAEVLSEALGGILQDIESGEVTFDPEAEDIHMFVESRLTERVGEVGKRLHTARSRNDQVALDLKLYMKREIDELRAGVLSLISALHLTAEANRDAIMPGYTHLQRAQPITFGFHMLAYCQMFMRDVSRLDDCKRRLDTSPIGACAMSGTTYPTDRAYEASVLGFSAITANAEDSVSDRDHVVELEAALSLIMMHLSRLSEEIIIWSSWEFGFVTLSDAYTTGSSIMPQKKNSDMAELVRGKTGRVYGDLMATLTMLKGLPLAYNKDMQEDKEALFDAIDTVRACLGITAPMIKTMMVNRENMLIAAKRGFINATDLADYLTKKGMPFRSAYKLVGQIVGRAVARGIALEDIPLAEYRELSEVFCEDLYGEISLETCISKRISAGSTGYASVDAQLAEVTSWLEKNKK